MMTFKNLLLAEGNGPRVEVHSATLTGSLVSYLPLCRIHCALTALTQHTWNQFCLSLKVTMRAFSESGASGLRGTTGAAAARG